MQMCEQLNNYERERVVLYKSELGGWLRGAVAPAVGTGLRNGVVVQHWHLVDLGSGFSQRLPLLDWAAHDATRSSFFFFRLLASEFGDAEDELQAAELDVAAMVEERCAFPARTTAPYQTGAARLAAARPEVRVLGLAAHHSANVAALPVLLLFLLPLFTATWMGKIKAKAVQ